MTSDLDIARADSRDCTFCNGDGMRAVFAPGYNGDAIVRDREDRAYGARVVATCLCPLGRFIRAKMPDDVRCRTPEVDLIAQGRSLWLLDDPTEEPVVDSSAPADDASWRNLWRLIREGRIAKPIP
jgi:hypothetical protein